VLLFPGAVVAKIAEACCGTDVTDLVVTDEPDPVCVGLSSNISGTYVVFSAWSQQFPVAPYDTGVNITIFDSGNNLMAEYAQTLGTGQSDPGVYPGTGWSFEQLWTPTAIDTYTYEVSAWTTTSWGTMTDIVGGEITVEECCVSDMALEQEIRDRLAAECPEDAEYKNHGAYISCAAQIIDEYLEAGDITEEEASCFMNPIARSRVGIPDKSQKPGKGPK